MRLKSRRRYSSIWVLRYQEVQLVKQHILWYAAECEASMLGWGSDSLRRGRLEDE